MVNRAAATTLHFQKTMFVFFVSFVVSSFFTTKNTNDTKKRRRTAIADNTNSKQCRHIFCEAPPTMVAGNESAIMQFENKAGPSQDTDPSA